MRVELREVAVPVPGNSSFAAAAASGNSSFAAAAAADPGKSSREVAEAAAGCDPLVFGRDCGGIKPKIRFKR
jgi:hypothetical protein